jgi:[protein-PII] uridylyltransferase
MSGELYNFLYETARTKLKSDSRAKRSVILDSYKAFLRQGNEKIKHFHQQGADGLEVVRAMSFMMDLIIKYLFAYAFDSFDRKNEAAVTSSCLCVIALGGYGRNELSPLSDIDIMFLYQSRLSDLNQGQKVLTETILYMLWDLGLKVGHSVRTIKEAISEAKNNIETKNALLETHFIVGSRQLYKGFKTAYKNYYTKEGSKNYIESRLAGQKERRKRYGNTIFLQEPNIKNGVGGLRDYQNILWMACVKMNITNINELRVKNYLSKSEHEELIKAYDFLLRVRNELHFQSERPTDLLDLEKQPAVAWGLGYKQQDIFERVEIFMKDYYSHAKKIFSSSTSLEQQIFLNSHKGSLKMKIPLFRRKNRKSFDGFVLNKAELTFDHPKIFTDSPERLIRVFRHCQQLRVQLSIELTNLIHESLDLITTQIINSPSANKCFRSILQSAGDVYPTLSKMHELNVLDRFFPEFSKLSCLVQYEYYHRYTADIHTLDTINQLDNVFINNDKFAKKYNRQIHKTNQPTLLYLILFLHDIGKVKGIAGHAQLGAQIADPVLERMHIDPEQKKQILFIIKNHLEMTRVWQRFDINDPRTIQAFAEHIGDKDKLRYLYVHTYCDARGTSTDLWNEYKDMLHTQLFEKTLEQLGDQEALKKQNLTKNVRIKTAIFKKLSDLPREEIETHFNLLPDHYLTRNNVEEIVLHLKMINQLLKQVVEGDSAEALKPVVHWQNDLNLSMTVVNIVTIDRAKLFYKLAGAFKLAGFNIISSQALSRKDNITIDTFYVYEPQKGIVPNKTTQQIFNKYLEDTLVHGKDLLDDIIAYTKQTNKPSLLRQPRKLHSLFSPSINFYNEPSLRQTIVEVKTQDRMGILYHLAKTISDHGFDIVFARITTEHGMAVDTFHIKNIEAIKTNETSRLLALRKNLDKILSSEHP